MAVLLIADIHLRKEESIIIDAFLRFLRNEAVIADKLYILGDLFESWIGDDDPNPLHRKIAIAIKQLVDFGIPCYFIHGNRDFLIGQSFAQESGMILLPEEKVLKLYEHKILIMHGDTLCTNDVKYQMFRSKIHKPWIRKTFLSLPLYVRKRIGMKIRKKSKIINFRKSFPIMNANLQTVIEVMEKYQVQILIYGHTHCPKIYKLSANGQSAFCIVLGAWCNEGSMVKITNKDIELLRFPL